MNKDLFKDKMTEQWWRKLSPFFVSEQCDEIYKQLKEFSKAGKKIAPNSDNTFRVFQECELSNVNVVMVFMDPYFKFVDGNPIADGVALSCKSTGKLQPSLQHFYKGLEAELYNGMGLDLDFSADIDYLCHQGILMLNAALTVEEGKAGSHIELWKPFTTYLFENVINYMNVPVIFVGNDAQKYMPLCKSPHQFKLSHPASASYTGKEWNTNSVFTEVNEIVLKNNGKTLQWMMLQECPF
jgi:uracil-DNA glycosylase